MILSFPGLQNIGITHLTFIHDSVGNYNMRKKHVRDDHCKSKIMFFKTYLRRPKLQLLSIYEENKDENIHD